MELQARYDSERFGVYLGYSYNRALAQNFDIYTASPTLDHLNMNMPAHQIAWTADWHITDALSWDISGTYLDRRAAYAFPNPTTPSILGRQVLLHTHLNYQWRQFDFGFGVRDLLNQKELLGEPYVGGGVPYRLSGTTFFAQLGLRFSGAP